MAKYTVLLSVNRPVELKLYKLDAEMKKMLDDAGGVEEVGQRFFFENEWLEEDYEAIVMNENRFEGFDPEQEDFYLEVKDEKGKVVYKTNDPMAVRRYPCIDREYLLDFLLDDDENVDEDEVDRIVHSFNFKGVEPGTYLVENYFLRFAELNGEFEADEFDPSKLAFFPSEQFDHNLCEDDVFLSELRYEEKEIGMFDEKDMDYDSEFNVLEATELNDYGCNFRGYRVR